MSLTIGPGFILSSPSSNSLEEPLLKKLSLSVDSNQRPSANDSAFGPPSPSVLSPLSKIEKKEEEAVIQAPQRHCTRAKVVVIAALILGSAAAVFGGVGLVNNGDPLGVIPTEGLYGMVGGGAICALFSGIKACCDCRKK